MEQLWSSSVHRSSLTLLEAVLSLNQIQKVYLTFFLTWHTLKLNHEHEHEGISFIFSFFVYISHLDIGTECHYLEYLEYCYINCLLPSSVVCATGLRILEMNNNSPPLTFKRFQTIVSRLELPRRPLPPISQQQMDKCCTKIADNHDQLFNIPTLEELGIHQYYRFLLCSVDSLENKCA